MQLNDSPATAAQPAVRNKNELVKSLRKWHIWTGVAVALFLSFFFITGMLMGHKNSFFPKKDDSQPAITAPGETRAPDAPKEKPREPAWWKTMKDLHTGKFFGEYGPYINDVIGLAGMFLACSGLYLWAAAKFRKAPKLPS